MHTHAAFLYIGGECTFYTAKSADIKKNFSKTMLLFEALFGVFIEECIRSADFLRYVVYFTYPTSTILQEKHYSVKSLSKECARKHEKYKGLCK